MKKVFTLFVLIFATSVYSQETGSIRGTISDLEDFNEPLLMANVQIKNTDLETRTNLNGNFELNNINPGSYTLVVRFLGYETIEQPLEVKENEVTQIAQGLRAQSLSLDDITALVAEDTEDYAAFASIQKANKE